MTDVPVNQIKIGDRPAEKKEGQTVENQKIQTLEKIRVELNLEKWPIWKPSHSRNEQKRAEVFERQITLLNGSKENAQLIVNAIGNLSLFTTEDQRTLYASIKLWEDAGKPASGIIPFSLRKVAKIKKKKWGSDTLKEIIDSLEKHRGILFKWVHSFYDSTTGETLHNLDYFNIFQDLKIAYRTKGDKVGNKAVGYFRFHDLILKNLLANHTKPLYLDVILNFKSEIAQLIYTRIDLIIANKTRYERRTKELFEDLNLEGKRYIYPSVRKQLLDPALKELQGVFLSTGILIEARLEKTKDEKDYKVVFIKQPFSKNEEPRNGAGEKEEQKKEQPILVLPQLDPQVVELVQYFHQKLGRPNHEPSSKELDQAAALLAECGFDKSKHTINFAVSEAETTNFQMRSFGALFQYKSEALRRYEKQKRDFELRLAREAHFKKEEEENHKRVEQEQAELDALCLTLTEFQKQKLEGLIIARVQNNPFARDPNSSLHEVTKTSVKHDLLREFKTNPDLLAGDPAGDPQTPTADLVSVSISPETLVLLLPARTTSGIREVKDPTHDPFLS